MPALSFRRNLMQTLERMDKENVYNRRHLRRVMRNPAMMRKLQQELSQRTPQKLLGVGDTQSNRMAILKFLWENRAQIVEFIKMIISLFPKT